MMQNPDSTTALLLERNPSFDEGEDECGQHKPSFDELEISQAGDETVFYDTTEDIFFPEAPKLTIGYKTLKQDLVGRIAHPNGRLNSNCKKKIGAAVTFCVIIALVCFIFIPRSPGIAVANTKVQEDESQLQFVLFQSLEVTNRNVRSLVLKNFETTMELGVSMEPPHFPKSLPTNGVPTKSNRLELMPRETALIEFQYTFVLQPTTFSSGKHVNRVNHARLLSFNCPSFFSFFLNGRTLDHDRQGSVLFRRWSIFHYSRERANADPTNNL